MSGLLLVLLTERVPVVTVIRFPDQMLIKWPHHLLILRKGVFVTSILVLLAPLPVYWGSGSNNHKYRAAGIYCYVYIKCGRVITM